MFITIGTEDIETGIELNNTATARKLFEQLPYDSVANFMEGILYFAVPVVHGLECPGLNIEKGDVVYWPEIQAVLIFLGKTDLSTTKKPIPPGLVTKIGRVSGNIDNIRKITDKHRLKIKSVN